jgi:hypothetical protein
MIPFRRALLAAGTLAVAAGLVLVAPLPASAADASVEYSTDGTTWSTTAPGGLFPAGTTIAPGITRTATLYVRALRPGDTIVGLFLGNAGASDPALLSAARVTTDGGAAVPLDGDRCVSILPQTVLAQGQVLTIPLHVGLDPDLTTGSGTGGGLGFDLLLELSEPGPLVLADGCPIAPEIVAAFAGRLDVGAPSPLQRHPGTGGEFPAEGVLLGVALFAGGAIALGVGLRAGRRRGDR